MSASGLWKRCALGHLPIIGPAEVLLWLLGPSRGSQYMNDCLLPQSSWEPSALRDCCLGGVYLHLQLACGQGQRLVPAECGSSVVWTIQQGQVCKRPASCCALWPLVECVSQTHFTGGLTMGIRSICLLSCVLPLICCACAAAWEAAYPSCTDREAAALYDRQHRRRPALCHHMHDKS